MARPDQEYLPSVGKRIKRELLNASSRRLCSDHAEELAIGEGEDESLNGQTAAQSLLATSLDARRLAQGRQAGTIVEQCCRREIEVAVLGKLRPINLAGAQHVENRSHFSG